MILQSPDLKRRINSYTNSLTDSAASRLQPLGADQDTLDGLNPHAVIIDEVHAHKTSGVVDVLKTAVGARRQPLMISTTMHRSSRLITTK